jgi:23S rRNA (uracil1939-C5)-methyltransferase
LGPHLQGQGEVSLALWADGRVTLRLATPAAQSPTLYKGCEQMVADETVAGIALSCAGAAAATWGQPQEVLKGVDGAPLVGPSGGFSQANEEVNAALVRAVVELSEAQDKTVLELYCGHGNLTTALSPLARKVWAVEQVPEAVEACRANLEARGLHHVEVICQDAAQRAGGPKVDVVVLDPPRTGAREVVSLLPQRRPERIVYVSCDTATLKRDVRALREEGYRCDRALAFDMFPQTAHVEAVVRLVRGVG